MDIAEVILEMALLRGRDKTICPSEAARMLWPGEWRNHMAEARETAFDLSEKGKVEILQKGRVITEREVKGPIRIRIV